MKHFNKDIGFYGESLAKNLLESKDHKVIDKNFYSSFGEIDLISKDKNILVFTEVKTRVSLKFGTPLESLTLSKIKNIKKIATYYLHKNKLYDNFVRFDVIEVFIDLHKSKYVINHIEDAFR